MKILLTLFLFVEVACTPGSNPTNPINSANTNKYFFDCTVDGKHIHADYTYPVSTTTNTGVTMGAYVASMISTGAGAIYCNTPGSYCFTYESIIQGQTTGTYTPQTFIISTTEGANYYVYNMNYLTGSPIDLTVIISQINRSSTYPLSGVLKGTFSGKLYKIVPYPTQPAMLPVTGSFSLPL